MEDAKEPKSRQHEKNLRRAQKKRARKAKSYSGASLASTVPLLKKSKGGKTEASNSKKSQGGDDKSVLPPINSKLANIFEAETELNKAGERVLEWLIAPTKVETFLKENYQAKPLLVRRGQGSTYFDGLLTKDFINKLLVENKLNYTRDFSLTQYKNGARKTLMADSTSVANAKKVWNLFDGPEKCSLRLLRPHNHSEPVWKLIAALEAFWNCGGGSNAYLTPKGSQGFAPHYDDVDAFILQLEGKKAWTVYHPYAPPKQTKSDKTADKEQSKTTTNEDDDSSDSDDDDDDLEEGEEDPRDLFPRNPRASSDDFTQEQVDKHLRVAHSVTLEPGDMLYIPRGFVHQAKSLPEEHSLHVTLSTGQCHTYADFIAMALPHAIEKTCFTDKARGCAELRKTLPRDLGSFLGMVNCDHDDDERRENFALELAQLIQNTVLANIDFDIIADRLGVKFQFDRHKPLGVLKALPSSAGESSLDSNVDEEEDDIDEVTLQSKFVLAAKGVATLTVEGDAALVYHSCKNSTTYHEVPERGLEFELEDAVLIEQVLNSSTVEPVLVRHLKHPTGSTDDLLRVLDFLSREKIIKVVL